ncbi:MAG: ComEC/Rec2 family competence protein [Candidatus Paceibacterota bacterium]
MRRLRKIIILLIVGFLLGIFLAGLDDLGGAVRVLFLVLALAFGLLFFLYQRSRIFGVLVLIFLGVTLGLFRYSLFSVGGIDNFSSTKQTVVGLIVADPDRRDKSTRLIVELNPSTTLRVTTRVLVVTDNFIDYHYGDQIELTGKLQPPENFLTQPSSQTSARQSRPIVFDYRNYLLVRGIGEISYYPKIKILARGEGSALKAGLFKLKNRFLTNLRQVLPEPASTLAGGLILGDKGGLGPKTEEEFRQAGMSHIIVLSGYNIIIVAENVLKLFSWFSPFWSWLLGLGSIFLFVWMTGGEAAAVRSAVMAGLALIARRFGRTYEAGVALVLAGFLMVLWNPRLLAFDLGFQLSFLATLGLIYLSPIVEKGIDKISRGTLDTKLKWLKEIIATTTGAQIAVYPWLLWRAGNASLVGFISNIFALPAVPFAMFASFVTGITGFTSHFLSLLVSYPTYFLLEYILQIAHWFAGLV